MTLAAFVPAVCETSQSPMHCGSVVGFETVVGHSVSHRVCFDDPDGDILSFRAESSDSSIAWVAMDEREIRVTGIDPGDTEVSVTATDPDGLTAVATYSAKVENVLDGAVTECEAVTRGSSYDIAMAGWAQANIGMTSVGLFGIVDDHNVVGRVNYLDLATDSAVDIRITGTLSAKLGETCWFIAAYFIDGVLHTSILPGTRGVTITDAP